jgi:hypothetical protein
MAGNGEHGHVNSTMQLHPPRDVVTRLARRVVPQHNPMM